MISLLLLAALTLLLIPKIHTYLNQCSTDSDCPYDKSCNKEICSDPCIGSCGTNTTCIPMNHGAYCSCSPGFSGDPFDICYEDPEEDPYDEYLCGPYSKFVNVTSVDDSYCLCLETFRGRPPNCTFIDCYTDDDCFWNENCDFNECVDPCDPNPCGQHSKCRSEGHQRARCTCDYGYFPEANNGCRLERPNDKLVSITKIEGYPCFPFCGYQASCEVSDGKIECYCEEINKYNPFMECPRLVDTDHICANANKPECGVSLAQIFKHYMHQGLDYEDDEKHRIGIE